MHKIALTSLLALLALAPAPAPAADSELNNVALTTLGATAKGSGAPFNRDWPAINALKPGRRGGTIFGAPLTGGRVDIRLVVPVDIQAIEVVPLDYHGTRQPKTIRLYVDGDPVKQAELPHRPGTPHRIPLQARGQYVGIEVLDEHPVREVNGRPGPTYGGWNRLRVLSTTDVAALMEDADAYDVPRLEAAIAPTGGSAATGDVEVVGQPRRTQGHPCTLWDAEDIARYKRMLETSDELRIQVEGLLRAMDKRIVEPAGIPQPQRAPDGSWQHLPSTEYGAVHNALALDIANLGAAYALSDDEKYGDYAKKLLRGYADVYARYGIGARPGFRHDPSKVFDQRLGDATWLIQVARGYDLIYNLPSLTPDERRHIEDDLIRPAGRHILANRAMRSAPTNWSAIAMASVLMAGYAIDDEDLIREGLYGGGDADTIKGGAFYHFGPDCIDADGMWSEGAMGYQFMALEALVTYAEVAWHHGIDLYRHRDAALKRLFDSPLQYAYPDLTTPAIHDSGHGSIVGRESFLYEFAYRRYRDPRYLPILDQAATHLVAKFQQFPVSVLYDLDTDATAEATEPDSVNFFGVGYGILRHTDDGGTTSLLLDYGPHRSHSHPDKLNIDLWTFGDRLIPDPGSVWYEQPLYRRWYHTTLSHNTLIVDELDQRPTAAEQLTYGPAATLSIQRARTNDAYPGVLMDRAVFLTPDYLADLFGAFGRVDRTMDLAWHIRGECATDLAAEPFTFPEPREMGYVALDNCRRATTDGPWQATLTRPAGTARFLAAGGTPTDVILGDGHLGMERPITILLRRRTDQTIYGSVVDISDAPDRYVKRVMTRGSLDAGYALMSIETAQGEDLCFAAYRPGKHDTGFLTTDAQQAFVLRDGPDVRAAYLGGGTLLCVNNVAVQEQTDLNTAGGTKVVAVEGITLERNTPGLVVLERVEPSSYILTNPSSETATITVGLPALAGMGVHGLDAKGRRADALDVRPDAAGRMTVTLPAAGSVEFAPEGAASAYEHRQAMLRRRRAREAESRRVAREAALERRREREAKAEQRPVPPGTVVIVQAEDFTAQDGGEIRTSTTKRGIVGGALYGWDAVGHWIEWTVDAPADGYYHLTLAYCSELVGARRELRVNGEVVEADTPLVFPGTGGWANASDDWRLLTAPNPVAERPRLIRLSAGTNTIRLTNTNGRGVNLDYLAITSPDVTVTRETLLEAIR
ncbi:MAG: heparinase II/III domain-containing protein [Planctomycetota bacterium]